MKQVANDQVQIITIVSITDNKGAETNMQAYSSCIHQIIHWLTDTQQDQMIYQ